LLFESRSVAYFNQFIRPNDGRLIDIK